MQNSDLKVFDSVPFFFWAKDEEGCYIWANQALKTFAKEDLVGKKDSDLPWSNDANALEAVDKAVLESGETKYIHEHLKNFPDEEATLSVCKFSGELDGKKCTFGISFIIGRR